MKNIYQFFILVSVIVAVIFACEKDKNNNITTFPNEEIGFRGDTLDYNDCPAIKDSVYKS